MRVTVTDSLDDFYKNPEFKKAADQFIGVIRDHIVREQKQEPTTAKLLKVANEILESRTK